MNNTSVIPHHKFSSMMLSFMGRQRRFILVNPPPFALIIVKIPNFSSPVIIFFKNASVLSRKKICCNGYTIFLILLTKSTRNPNAQLAHFSYLFQVVTDCGLGCFEVKWKLHFINSLKASWLRFDERPGFC